MTISVTARLLRNFLILLTFAFSATSFAKPLIAFPTAEGYGKYTVGGRGGKVYQVSNLNDSGKGSLRDAINAKEPRTVVFTLSGTIVLKSDLEINNPFITIAGQTAPGDGITLRGYPLMINADEVIVRYIRVRLGDESGGASDAISSRYTNNLILDHVSASWSVDETVSIYHCSNVTVQWSIISESLYESNHTKGSDHGYGAIWGGNQSSYHHNLFAHHSSRNPRFASGSGNTDYRNNVLYNWGFLGAYGGEALQQKSDKFTFTNINMVANYQKAGPATAPGAISHLIIQPWTRNKEKDYGKWHVDNNTVEGNDWVSNNNWQGGVQLKESADYLDEMKLEQPWPAMPITQQPPKDAYQLVLSHAGASLPKRDSVDLRIVDEVKNGYATYEGSHYEQEHQVADASKMSGIIDSQQDVGGWPILTSTPAPVDSDHDGMPDNWELTNNLNPNDDRDRNNTNPQGYTMLEVYINGMQ